MDKKRLFQITELRTKRAVPELFFSDKKAAKHKRSELNGGEEAEQEGNLRFVVSPGPDHHNFQS